MVLGAGLLCVGVFGPLLTAGPAAAAPNGIARVALQGELPKLPSDASRLGAVPDSQTLHLEVSLAGQDPAGLSEEVAAVSTPGSPSYHHYLTSAQFAAAYGPSSAEVQQVSSALRAEGLTVGTPTSGSTLLPVSGTAHTVSTVFDTPLESVRLPGHVTSMVNTAAPKIPATLADEITGVVGLSGLSQEHALLRRHARSSALTIGAPPVVTTATTGGPGSGPQACPAAVSAAALEDGYTSTQLAGYYGLSQLFAQGRTGIGQTIAIVEFEQFSSADVAAFQACYGLSNPVRTVVVDGTPSGSPAGSGEAALDIEMAVANAPSSSIIVYEAPNETSDGTALDLYNRIATDDLAQVITTSWGECEQLNTPESAASAENTVFERMAAQGQTMVAASGDEGSEDCYSPSTNQGAAALAVDDPGSQPDVLSVGGTSLVNGAVASQSVWNNCEGTALGDCQQNGGNGATGGGYSSVWTKPTWQPAGPTARGPGPVLLGRSGPWRGVLFRPQRRLVVHRGDECRLAGDRGIPGRRQSGLCLHRRAGGTDALRRGQRRQLHRRDDGQQRLHGDEQWNLRRHGGVRPRHGARDTGGPESRHCAPKRRRLPLCRRFERVLGGGLGRPGHHADRWRPGRRHQSHLRFRRGGDDPVALGELPRRRATLAGTGPLCRRHRDQPPRDLAHLSGHHLRLRQFGQL